MVSLGNAPGDGEPHTEAAVGGAGLIRPIEPVKELLCLPLGQRRTGIAAPQDDARFVFFSSAAMTSGETYTLTSGGTVLGAAAAVVVVVLRKQKKA